MADILTVLHPENDADIDLYPNIKKDNIPDGAIDRSKLDNNINGLLDNIGELQPSGVDTAANILAKTADAGIWVGSDTGKWYYWNGSQYVVGGDYIVNISNSVSHTKEQLLDNNGNNLYPNTTNIKLPFASGDFNSSTGLLTTNIYRLVNPIDIKLNYDIKISMDWVTYKIFLYEKENNIWVAKGWKVTDFTITANTVFRLILSAQATITKNLSYYQVIDMLNSLHVNPVNDTDFRKVVNYQKYNNFNMKAIAHRGLSMFAPENTASSFKAAKLFGFDYVECDVHYTSDDVPVIIHDYTINRTSNGTGNVADLTLAQLKTYDFGSWFNSDFTGEKILTLEEFIILMKKLGLKAYIELKNIGSWQVRARHAREIIALIKSYNMLDSIIFISASGTYLEEIKNVAPSIRLGYVSSNLNLEDSDVVRFIGLKTATNKLFFDLENNSNITSNIISYAITNDIGVETWVINDGYYIDQIDKYINGITTNGILFNEVIIYTMLY